MKLTLLLNGFVQCRLSGSISISLPSSSRQIKYLRQQLRLARTARVANHDRGFQRVRCLQLRRISQLPHLGQQIDRGLKRGRWHQLRRISQLPYLREQLRLAVTA